MHNRNLQVAFTWAPAPSVSGWPQHRERQRKILEHGAAHFDADDLRVSAHCDGSVCGDSNRPGRTGCSVHCTVATAAHEEAQIIGDPYPSQAASYVTFCIGRAHDMSRNNRLMRASLGWLADRRKRARTVLLSPGEPSRARCCLVCMQLPGLGCAPSRSAYSRRPRLGVRSAWCQAGSRSGTVTRAVRLGFSPAAGWPRPAF